MSMEEFEDTKAERIAKFQRKKKSQRVVPTEGLRERVEYRRVKINLREIENKYNEFND